MTTEEWEEFQSLTMGNYVGIGIYMGVDKNNNIVVLAPIEQSPAERVGIKTGDIIVEVDGENALGVSSDIVSSKIKGEEGAGAHRGKEEGAEGTGERTAGKDSGFRKARNRHIGCVP